jgi:hypothetical protein
MPLKRQLLLLKKNIPKTACFYKVKTLPLSIPHRKAGFDAGINSHDVAFSRFRLRWLRFCRAALTNDPWMRHL